MRGWWSWALIVALPLLPVGATPPDHLVWAQRLVADLRAEENSYGVRPTVVQWRGVDGALRSHNHSVCSTFISALFQRAYGYGPSERRRWLGQRSPRAVDYYQAIAAGQRFRLVRTLGELAPGDLLASRQLNPTATSTGHLMLAAGRPEPVAPCVAGRCAYRLVVIDCLTLWLTRLLMPAHGPALDAAAPVQALCEAIRQVPGPVVLVGNEIGLGVIPMGREVRAFVDALGLLNQSVAAACDRVTLMVAGLPLTLKEPA